MEIPISPEIEAKLERMAAEKGVTAVVLVQNAVEQFANYDEWFAAEVQKGLDQLDRGEYLSHEDVMARINRIVQGQTQR